MKKDRHHYSLIGGASSAACTLIALLLALNTVSAQSHDGHDHAGHGDHAHPEVGPLLEHPEHDQHEDPEHAESRHGDHEGHANEGLVSVPDAILREFDITLAQAAAGTLHEEVILPGEIKFNREQLAYITPRFAGTVTAIRARLADEVEPGQVLATLESSETLRPFEVKAPFAGTIVDYTITLGETVDAGTRLFILGDLSTVWADLRIYLRDMAKVRQGQRVVVVNGHEGPQFEGTITYIAPTIDEHTRTGLARVVIDNADGAWRPGQFIKGSVSIDEHRAGVVIPRSAVLTHEGASVVFVRTAEGIEPRPVVLGHRDENSIEVLSGLEPGQTYVARNAISLKAEMNKGSFGGHEGHVH